MSRRDLVPLEIGATVADRYLVEKCLGVGSCAMVYSCVDKHFKNRTVALKVFHPINAAKSGPTPARFRKEVLYSYEINHRNIVRTFDFIETDELTALTMELIEGGDMLDLIDSQELSISATLDLLMQICAGVQAIHDAEIVHRDLKPENILISHDGVVKIADFSIAWMDNTTKLTQHGNILGSISFISPEYLEFGQLDSRADLYAIGIIAYQMLTNETPFDGVTMHELIRAKVHDKPPTPHELRPECPKELSDIVMKAMKPDPEQRYQSAAEIYSALTRFKEITQLSTEREATLSEVIGVVLPERTELHQNVSSKGQGERSLRALGAACAFAFLGYGSWIAYTSTQSNAKPTIHIQSEQNPTQMAKADIDVRQNIIVPAITPKNSTSPLSKQGIRDNAEQSLELPPSKELQKSELKEKSVISSLPEKTTTPPQAKIPQKTPKKKPVRVEKKVVEKAKLTKKSIPPQKAVKKITKKPASVPKTIQVAKVLNPPDRSPAADKGNVTVEDAATLEYKVKATLLYKFIDLIDWNDRIADSSQSVELCVVGHDPFGDYLQSLISGKRSARNKRIHVSRLSNTASRSNRRKCHLAFISGWRTGNDNRLVEKFHRARVLTVTEKLSSGIVHFFVLRGNVRFDINERQANRLGVEIDPKLLKLARETRIS